MNESMIRFVYKKTPQGSLNEMICVALSDILTLIKSNHREG